MKKSSENQNSLIILGVTGSIAAYKGAYLARLFVQNEKIDLRVTMTKSAAKFVGPVTFEAITNSPVYIDQCSIPPKDLYTEKSGIGHTDMTAAAKALVIAPATANSLAKLAHGFADDAVAVLALAMPRESPVLVAPAMNPRMWAHPAVQSNIETLRQRGVIVLAPAEGDTACRDIGQGRMVEPEEIYAFSMRHIALAAAQRKPRKVLILNGPTREHFDDVRFISNGSSGRMGVSLAEAVFEAGDDVRVISGPAAEVPPHWIPTKKVESAEEMFLAAKQEDFDVLLSPAAVADYAPLERSPGKPAKSETLTVTLQKTPDVIAQLAKSTTGNRPIIVAFAAEESLNEEAKAFEKAKNKGADFIVLNDAKETMGSDTASVKLLKVKDSSTLALEPGLKENVARQLWRAISGNLI